MTIKLPESMNEVIYFTNRKMGEGQAKAWVHKMECLKCKKELMGKPVVKGKIKIRATEYVCPGCGYTEEKREHEDKLIMEIMYTCPHCQHKGEATASFKRKTFEGVQANVFQCDSCNKNIGITKKMKVPKKK